MTQTMKFIDLCFFLLMCVSNPLLPAQEAAVPSWTSVEGKTIQGKFIKLAGESVVILKDGKEVTIPFTRLAPASIAQAKQLAMPPAPKVVAPSILPPPDAEGLQPLWVCPSSPWFTPGHEWLTRYLGLSADGDLLFVALTVDEDGKQNEAVVALVSKTTGKLLWKTPLEIRKDSRESPAAAVVLPDGNIVVCAHSLRPVPKTTQYEGQLRIRKFDGKTGKLLHAMQVASDNPASSQETGRIEGLNVSVIKISAQGEHPAILTSNFLMEMDATFTKATHSCLAPKPCFLFFLTPRGAMWIEGERGEGSIADWGGAARTLTKPEAMLGVKDQSPSLPDVRLETVGKTLKLVKDKEEPIEVAKAPAWSDRDKDAKMITTDLCLLSLSDQKNKGERYQVLLKLSK